MVLPTADTDGLTYFDIMIKNSRKQPCYQLMLRLLGLALASKGILPSHRNLRFRTSMLAKVLQIFWGKEHLVKSWLISTLDKVIYCKGTIFLRSTKLLFTSLNRVETS
jgi:hypothetical protein